MNTLLKILLLEDNDSDAEMIRRLLAKSGVQFEYRRAMTREEYVSFLHHFEPDVILADNDLPQFSAVDALDIMNHFGGHTPFILVTGTVSEEFAVNMIKNGADDYILKDRLERLPAAIEAAIKKRTSEREKMVALELTKQSEEKYRTLVERVSDGFISIDQDWNFTYLNKVAEAMLGRTASDLIGKNIWTEFPSAIDQPFYEAYHEAMKLQRNIYVENYSVALGLWLHASVYPSASGISVYFRDISEQRKTAGDLLENQMRLKQAQAIAHLGNWEHNFETGVSRWSEETYRIYGISPGRQLKFKDWLTYVYPDDLPAVKEEIERSRGDLSDHSFEHRILRKDGEIRHVYTQARYDFDDEGRPLGVYGITHDITEKKKLEFELREQHRKEQLKMTAAALEAQEKERNAIGIELHDNVNQILAGTKLLLSMVSSDPQKHKHLIRTCMDTLQNAIEENRKLSHALVAPDFDEIPFIEQLTNLSNKMLRTSGIDARIDTKGFSGEALHQEQLLTIYRILQEQCTNIVKYSKATQVTITLGTEGDLFRMIISDNGIGMNSDEVTTGIGLRNIKGRLSILNGTLEIKTAPGKGFTLEITMPLIK